MSHIVYKTKERYSFGWTDPHMIINATLERDLINHEFSLWTTEQLRNAWLVRFGSDWIPFKDLSECEDKDYMDIGIMLDRKKQLETIHRPDQFFPLYRLIPCK